MIQRAYRRYAKWKRKELKGVLKELKEVQKNIDLALKIFEEVLIE
jgi:hypothetical protein